MRATPPLSWSNVIGYGLGDMANNFVFAMGALFLLNYYTDVVGITAAAAGTLLASVRIYNALTDVVAGRVVDRTSTRWGHCRPFLLWGGLPLLLLSVAVFSVPAGWEAGGKLAYAYVSYGLLVTAYSFVNIPYGSLAAAMTQATRERACLGASRTLMAVFTGSFLAMVLGPLVVNDEGALQQDNLTRFTLLLAMVGGVLYFLCFKYSREIVERKSEVPKLRDSMNTLLTNRPLLILCASMLCILIGTVSKSASSIYFARYVLGDARQFFIIVGVTTLLGTLLAVPLVPLLVSRAGKKAVFLLGLIVSSAGYLALFFAPITSNAWIFCSLAVAGFGNMTAGAVGWALVADTVEYGEWRTGVRIEGLSYSFFSFSRKCGQALGGSVPAILLTTSGYIPNLAEQSDSARLGIQQAMALVPAVAFALGFVLMLFYPLTDRRFADLLREIEKRRAANTADAGQTAEAQAQ
jgi:glucuronide carrier protein